MSINKTSRCFDSSRKTGSRRTRICEKVAEYLKGTDLCQSSNKRSQLTKLIDRDIASTIHLMYFIKHMGQQIPHYRHTPIS